MNWSLDEAVEQLKQRLADGSLPPERAQLAAYVGDLPAFRALGDGAPDAPEELEAWVAGLAEWGREVLVRVGLACARLGWPVWSARETPQQLASSRVFLDEAVRWCRFPEQRPPATEAGNALVPGAEEVTVLLDSRLGLRTLFAAVDSRGGHGSGDRNRDRIGWLDRTAAPRTRRQPRRRRSGRSQRNWGGRLNLGAGSKRSS